MINSAVTASITFSTPANHCLINHKKTQTIILRPNKITVLPVAVGEKVGTEAEFFF